MSRPDFIETRGGVRFRPMHPRVEDIAIGDIAHALSQQCRFSGHTRVHYSVAEHSVRVSDLIEAQGFPLGSALWGLLHDASEAYLVDIPSPLKCLPAFAEYRESEEILMLAICVRFGLAPEEPPSVRRADEILLATEARDLMPFRPEHWSTLRAMPMSEVIRPWDSMTAKARFLHRFEELTR